MRAETPSPTGLARRGRRLSDRETEQRMLQAAVAMINRTGLTVSLDHISFEDVIRDADVSRSAVYRRWPYKDLFFSDLVKELAKAAIPGPAYNDAMVGLIKRIVTERLDWLDSPESRHNLIIELFRQAALLDFQSLYGSTAWRTYLALHATCQSLPEGELRDQIQAILAESQRGFISRVAQSWAQLVSLFGYRLRPELGASYETLAILLSAAGRGLTIMALSTPDIVARRTLAQPFGAAEAAEWSLPALGLGGIASSFVEPDPTVEWTAERRASVRHALDVLTVPQ